MQGLQFMSTVSAGCVRSIVQVLQRHVTAHRHVVAVLDRISNSDFEVGLHSCVCHLLLQG